jgi:hypothetical protein
MTAFPNPVLVALFRADYRNPIEFRPESDAFPNCRYYQIEHSPVEPYLASISIHH